ncbi:endoplasmic reticulum lectin 1 isoform X2 [Cynoglossus semilaevis]|uniref:endoplasmic reticulum lectin 1 isoform X2 n=1 Tax=Cynoglossus semilaevis TaxID=244447 RepID=UPI000497E7F1|nr:endoplasmic reticulum lectin 1 isoform X2 [Cynoglossus semilaevis]
MTAGLLVVVVGGLLEVCAGVSANRGGYPSFTDEIPFKITWPDADFTLPTSGPLYNEDDFVIMMTTEKEKYKCMLPSLTTGDEDGDKEYRGPTPADLLGPLFKRSSCSYRIELYWTYELCHGKHVRQYHEEKETGQISVQEYFLGNMAQKSEQTETDKEEEAPKTKSTTESEVHTKNIEGQLTPYYSVEMGNGTPCVLKQNQPRSTSVLYVCHPEAKHEILSVAEVTTCEYEVVVLTPLLCAHPKYRFKSSPVNAIFCQALAGSPLRPQRLAQLDKEQEEQLKPPFSSSTFESREEEAAPVREESFTSTHKPITVGGQSQVTVGTTHISRLTDDQLIKEFLSGSYCLHGGVGWWKYEFCYGRHVYQYHEDKEQGKNIVVVGSWNAEEHMEWAKKNVARSYQFKDDGVQKVKLVSHFYGHGDICDLTGKPRQVIVKLKCKESESPHAVTVYMLEPQTCQYILGVESPVICSILDTADEHGLLSLSR